MIICATVFAIFATAVAAAAVYDGYINLPGSWQAKVKEAQARTAIAEQNVTQKELQIRALQSELLVMDLETKRLELALRPSPLELNKGGE